MTRAEAARATLLVQVIFLVVALVPLVMGQMWVWVFFWTVALAAMLIRWLVLGVKP